MTATTHLKSQNNVLASVSLILLLLLVAADGFQLLSPSITSSSKCVQQPVRQQPTLRISPATRHHPHQTNLGRLFSANPNMGSAEEENREPTTKRSVTTTTNTNTVLASTILVVALTLAPLAQQSAANAYDASDFASDAVEKVIKSLKDADGNQDQIFQTYENIADIITEGTGVGGTVNYKGVTLERGYVADEDTSIYNPGLTLLTEGEKNQLVDAIIQSRQTGINKNQWSEKNQLAYEYLKYQLDPYHMTELKGYLKIVPALVGVLYLVVLGVQQFARGLFPVAYIAAVLAIVAPAILLAGTAQ